MFAIQPQNSGSTFRALQYSDKSGSNCSAIQYKAREQYSENAMLKALIPTIRKFCQYKLWNTQHRDDFQQDVLEIVLRKIRRKEINNPAALEEFCKGVCRNHLLSYIRKNANLTQRYCSLEESSCLEKDSTDNSNFSEQIEKKESYQKCKSLLANLSQERDKKIILEHYFYDKSPAVLASDLDMTESHFYRVLYRAKNRLRSTMTSCSLMQFD